MSSIHKKVIDRLTSEVPKFQKILKLAQDRDINEADTVAITADILSNVFGFDRYLEVTSEYAIRNTYCDLAVKIDESPKYLVEVKAIGLSLKENHLRQAINYGANKGVEWVVLTNGATWEIHRIRLDKSVNADKICEFNFLELNARKAEDQEILFLLCKEGLTNAKEALSEFHSRMQTINRFMIGAIILSDKFIENIRRELRKITSGLKVEHTEIEKILVHEVLKREVLEDEKVNKAKAKIKKAINGAQKKSIKPQ